MLGVRAQASETRSVQSPSSPSRKPALKPSANVRPHSLTDTQGCCFSPLSGTSIAPESESYGLAWDLSTRSGQSSLRTGQSLPPPEYFPVVDQHRVVAHWGPKQIRGLRESSRGIGGPKAWTAVPVPDPQSPASHISILPPCQVPLVKRNKRLILVPPSNCPHTSCSPKQLPARLFFCPPEPRDPPGAPTWASQDAPLEYKGSPAAASRKVLRDVGLQPLTVQLCVLSQGRGAF